MALSTRQVNISLRFPTSQTTATITFIPDLASGDGQVLLEETYTATITGGAPSTTLTGSINLPVKSSGYIGYRVKFPRETGYNEHYVYINAGSAVDLSDLLTLSAVQGTDLRLDDLSDVVITSAASGDYLRYNGTNWVDSTIQAGDLPSSIDATKIGAGTVDNTEFGYLNGVTSSIQTQLDGKVSGSGTSSGTNTGDQTITLTGDVTGSGTGSFAATIGNSKVTYAKIQNVSATDKILGRSTAGAGVVEEITCTSAGRALLDDADASAQRTTLGLGTLATQSGTFSGTSSGTNTGDQNLFSTIAVSGQSDVVADSTSDTLTLIAGSNITLTTNATNDSITIAATDTTGVTGSGTSGQVTYWNGSSTITGESDFTYDATNNALTVGAGKVGSASGYAAFADSGNFTTSNFAVLQTTAGATTINAKSGSAGIDFRVGNSSQYGMNFDGTYWTILYDSSNKMSMNVSSTGVFNFAAYSGTSAQKFTFNADVEVPDEAYGAGWNGSVEVPTKNAVYDKIQSMTASGDVTGPASSTDNAVTRFDSTTGKLLQNSTVLIDDNGKLAQVDAIDLDITPTTASNAIGRIIWNTTENSPEVGIGTGSVTSLLGVDLHLQVVNDTATSFSKGDVVRITGSTGDRLTVDLALGDNDPNNIQTIGVCAEAIGTPNGVGIIITKGILRGLNTNSFNEDDVLYLSPTTPGALTNTRPTAPNHAIRIGYVIKKGPGASGIIYVDIMNGFELGELHDVLLTSVDTNHFLVYDNTAGETRWENRSPANARTAMGLGTLATLNGSGTANQIAYWSSTSNISSLTTATYPSLTELSYVKGVTSAIQTQLNAAATLTGNNAFTGANTFTNSTGQIFRQAATQDGILLRGRAGGTTSLTVEIVPTTLSGSRTLTAPDTSGTIAVGTGTSNELTYWSGTNTLSTLSTATYPSLTELSYVKGVTSAIQTQINAKFTLPSLTSGSILFSDGSTIAQDNSNLYWDNSNDRLGISTTSPAAGIHVLKTTEQLRLAYDASKYTTFTVDSSGFLNMTVNGATAVTISTNGKTTIGAVSEGGVSDARKLDLTGAYGTNTAGNYANNKLVLYQSTTTNHYGLGVSAGLMEVQSDGDIAFFAESNVATKTERMRIKNNANRVGIGTSSPSYTLDVNGKVNAATGFVTRVTGTTSSATPTPDADATDLYSLTALATNPTFGQPTGTPANGQKMMIRIKDNGTARTLSWNAAYVAGGVSLPTTTVAGKIMHLGFIYNTDNSLNKWMLIAKSEEA